MTNPFLGRDMFVLTLRPLPGVDAIRALRWVLEGAAASARHAMCRSFESKVMSAINLNRATLSAKPISQQINALIEAAEPPSSNTRQYLGASLDRFGLFA